MALDALQPVVPSKPGEPTCKCSLSSTPHTPSSTEASSHRMQSHLESLALAAEQESTAVSSRVMIQISFASTTSREATELAERARLEAQRAIAAAEAAVKRAEELSARAEVAERRAEAEKVVMEAVERDCAVEERRAKEAAEKAREEARRHRELVARKGDSTSDSGTGVADLGAVESVNVRLEEFRSLKRRLEDIAAPTAAGPSRPPLLQTAMDIEPPTKRPRGRPPGVKNYPRPANFDNLEVRKRGRPPGVKNCPRPTPQGAGSDTGTEVKRRGRPPKSSLPSTPQGTGQENKSSTPGTGKKRGRPSLADIQARGNIPQTPRPGNLRPLVWKPNSTPESSKKRYSTTTPGTTTSRRLNLETTPRTPTQTKVETSSDSSSTLLTPLLKSNLDLGAGNWSWDSESEGEVIFVASGKTPRKEEKRPVVKVKDDPLAELGDGLESKEGETDLERFEESLKKEFEFGKMEALV